jgi:hypothetical protein
MLRRNINDRAYRHQRRQLRLVIIAAILQPSAR